MFNFLACTGSCICILFKILLMQTGHHDLLLLVLLNNHPYPKEGKVFKNYLKGKTCLTEFVMCSLFILGFKVYWKEKYPGLLKGFAWFFYSFKPGILKRKSLNWNKIIDLPLEIRCCVYSGSSSSQVKWWQRGWYSFGGMA